MQSARSAHGGESANMRLDFKLRRSGLISRENNDDTDEQFGKALFGDLWIKPMNINAQSHSSPIARPARCGNGARLNAQ